MTNAHLNGSRPRNGRARIAWPEGKQFAFTVFDDTDLATVANARPVYELLAECGVFVTKSVWPLRNRHGDDPEREGMDCEDTEYLDWVLELKRRGFEIGLHNVASGGCRRDETIAGIERFQSLFGTEPITYAAISPAPRGFILAPIV